MDTHHPTKQLIDEKPHKKQDLSDTGNIVADSGPGGGLLSDGIGLEYSFQRLYSKELDLDEDEVPIILHELNDSAIHFISREQYDRALSLLQKAQTLIDRLQFQKHPADRLMVYLTMHNMALCFQKMGALEECALCLEASLQTLNSPFLSLKLNGQEHGDPIKKLKRLKYECKTHMQVCALLSQLHRHKEALVHAERSVQIAQYMIEDMLAMFQHFYQKVLIAKKNEQIYQDTNGVCDSSTRELIYYDDSISMLERTTYRVYPIIQECATKLVRTNEQQDSTLLSRIEEFQTLISNQVASKPKLSMRALLGYLNQGEWLYLLNIGNIMQITPMTVHDLYTHSSYEVELTRDSVLEKISFLAVSYFCISTELRFLFQLRNMNKDAFQEGTEPSQPQIDPLIRKRESEFWHAKALDVAISFLPSESPLVTHILTSYQKHHAPVQQEIPEDQETSQGLRVIRPQPGIDVCKYQPLVRQDPTLNISIPQLPMSPNNYGNVLQKEKVSNNHQASVKTIGPNNQQQVAQSSISVNRNSKSILDSSGSQPDNVSQHLLSSQSNRFGTNPNLQGSHPQQAKFTQDGLVSNPETVLSKQEKLEQLSQHIQRKSPSPLRINEQILDNLQDDYDEQEDAADQDYDYGVEQLDHNNQSMLEQKRKHHEESPPRRRRDSRHPEQRIGENRSIENAEDEEGMSESSVSEAEEEVDKLFVKTVQNNRLGVKTVVKPHRVKKVRTPGDEMNVSQQEAFMFGGQEVSDVQMASFDGRSAMNFHSRHLLNQDNSIHEEDESSIIRVKRPKTSQGIRSGLKPKSLNQSTSIQQTSMRQAKQVHTNTITQAPSVDHRTGSPKQIRSGAHHQSMIMHSTSGKLVKNQAKLRDTVKTPIKPSLERKDSSNGRVLSSNQNQILNQSVSAAILASQYPSRTAASGREPDLHQHRTTVTNQSNSQHSDMASGGRKRSTSRGTKQRAQTNRNNEPNIHQTAANFGSNSHTALPTAKRLSNNANNSTTGLIQAQLLHQQPQRSGSSQSRYQTSQPQQLQNSTKTLTKKQQLLMGYETNPQPASQSFHQIPTAQQQQILNALLHQHQLNTSVTADSQNQTKRYIQEMDSFIKKKASGGGLLSGDSTGSIGRVGAEIEPGKQAGKMRSKSRGKPANTTTNRSKERLKLRSTVVELSPHTNIEELIQRQMKGSEIISRGQQRKGNNSSTVISIKKTSNDNQWLQNAQQALMQQQIPVQTAPWISQPSPQTVNTHQMIQKFLQERQQQQPLLQAQQMPLENNYNMQGSLPIQMAQETNNYKLQLSRKILQQQQKLLGVQNFQNNLGPKVKQALNEAHPGGIKRSATPMVEMHDFPPSRQPPQGPPNQQSQQQQLLAQLIPNLRLQALQSQEGKFTPDNPPQKTFTNSGSNQIGNKNFPQNQGIMNISQTEILMNSSTTMREDSISKQSAKKKAGKKMPTPKNVAHNNNQMIQSHLI